jgi:acetyltransferase-like isoleucine patch superfamily enzyme
MPTPVSVPIDDAPAPVQPRMTADGRYVITAELKATLNARGVDSAPPPDGRVLPPNSVFEPPCSLQWMDILGRISVGSFSYGVSGHFNNVTIGRYVSIGDEVQMGRGDHSIDWLSTSPFFYLHETIIPVGRDFADADAYHAFDPDTAGSAGFVQGSTIVIGNDVWIGHRAYVRPGVTIGTGAIIGAYAVVSRDVPPYAIVVGNPGRVVRYRFDEALIARLLASNWWTLTPWQLKGIDVSRPAESIDAIERRVAESEPYKPDPIHLVDLV